jgi:hypothetical protein
MRRIRSRLTYSNVMVTLLAFVVLGGGAYAAFHLPKNSVRSKNIVNRQVKSKDLSPAKFKNAGLEDFPGACGGLNQWLNNAGPNAFDRVSYARDGLGFVHLRGVALRCGGAASTVFQLPSGFRPGRTQSVVVPASSGPTNLQIEKTGKVNIGGDIVSFAGVAFRCAPSGKHGCP